MPPAPNTNTEITFIQSVYQSIRMECRRLVFNFSVSNAGLFGSDVDYGEDCENIDKKRYRATSRQSEQNASWARYMEMQSTS